MNTKASICNLALAYLGVLENPIADLDSDSTPTARKLRAVYDLDRQATLRDHAWKFANKEIPLSLCTDKEVIGWLYVYARPSDCLNILRIFNEATPDTTPSEKYDQINIDDELFIVTNCEDAFIKFTRDVTNPELFDASYCEMLAWKIAMSVALPLTGEISKQNNAATMYLRFKDAAQNSNVNESNVPQETTSSFIDAR